MHKVLAHTQVSHTKVTPMLLTKIYLKINKLFQQNYKISISITAGGPVVNIIMLNNNIYVTVLPGRVLSTRKSSEKNHLQLSKEPVDDKLPPAQ